MLFREVVDRVAELRGRVERFREELSRNELLTRYVLIDPFLRLLGWDTEDPGQVRPEFSTQTGRPDYALLYGGDRPLAFIGAKALGKTEDLQQYISYCVSEGVKYFVATDGARWEVYDTFALKPLPEKKIAEWDITRDEPGEVVRKAFILFRYSPFREQAPMPITIQEPSKPAYPEHPRGTSLGSFVPRPGSKMNFTEIVFPDGNRYQVKKWRDILLKTAEYLVQTNRLTSKDVPVRAGRKRYLINTKPIHPSGESFRDPKQISRFYVESNYNTKRIFRYSKDLLKRFGVDPSVVYLV